MDLDLSRFAVGMEQAQIDRRYVLLSPTRASAQEALLTAVGVLVLLAAALRLGHRLLSDPHGASSVTRRSVWSLHVASSGNLGASRVHAHLVL